MCCAFLSARGNLPDFTSATLPTDFADLMKVPETGQLKEDNRNGGFDAWLRRIRSAAEQGDRNAQYKLGQLYSQGFGLPKNPEEAVKWFRRAAEGGAPEGRLELAKAYYHGWGVPKNISEAIPDAFFATPVADSA